MFWTESDDAFDWSMPRTAIIPDLVDEDAEALAPDLLGGAKSFMIGSLIEEQFKGAAGNWPFGAAAAMILMSIVMVVLLVYARAQTREAKA